MKVHTTSSLWKTADLHVEGRRDFTMPRPSYLPEEVRGTDPIVPDGTDLAFWTWESNGVPYAIAFAGKAQKPLWHYRFRNESERQRQVDETTEDRRKALARKQQILEDRRNFQHGLQVGDIFVSSWGYDQTNVDFYEVTAVGDREVVIREIGKDVVRSDQYGGEQVVPEKGRYVGPPMRKRPSGSGGRVYIKVRSFANARKWDGRPVHQTAFGWGH